MPAVGGGAVTREEALALVSRMNTSQRRALSRGPGWSAMTVKHPTHATGLGFIDDSPAPRPAFLSPTLARESGPTQTG